LDVTGVKEQIVCYRVVYGWGNSWISLLVATNFWFIFNMLATMARRGARVQLEQSDMRIAMNMAKVDKGGFSRSTMEGTNQHITKRRGDVREEMKRGVKFPRYQKVKAAIDRHPAIVEENQWDGCLPCQNGTAKNLETRWRCKGMGAPLPEQAPPLPGMPSAPPGGNGGASSF